MQNGQTLCKTNSIQTNWNQFFPDSKVLVAYGDVFSGTNGSRVIFFNYSSNTKVFSSTLTRQGACLASLNTNFVLVLAGQSSGFLNLFNNQYWINKAVYNPSKPIITGRMSPLCVMLDNNTVMITGGFTDNWKRWEES